MTEKMPDLPPVYHRPSEQERNWAMLCQLGGLLGLWFPLGNIVAPLLIWLWKAEEMPFLKIQGKEAINFQITVFLAVCLVSPLVFIGIGYPLLSLIGIINVIFVIVAAVKNKEGEYYRYPASLRLIK